MKNKLLFILLIALSFKTNAQTLTLNELFAICNKSNWDQANELLMSKGWEYHESKKGDDEHYSTITWSYNKKNYTDRAESWFHLYTYDGSPNKISYTFFSKKTYTLIKSGISTSGMKLTNEMIEDNELIAKYSGGNYNVSITTQKRQEEDYSNENSITAYSVEVIKKAGIYDNNNGSKKKYFESGVLETEYTLLNNKLNGPTKAYYENGKVSRTSNFINGVENGKVVDYNENGEKKDEYNMVNGIVTGLVKVYENGLISKEFNKFEDVFHGLYTEYFYNDDNKLYGKKIGNYNYEKKIGAWNTYLIKDGKEELIDFVNYKDDIKDGEFKVYVSSDTIEIGTFKNGLLNGNFIRKKKFTFSNVDETSSTSNNSMWAFDVEGSYIDGLKNGKWTEYMIGRKAYEGEYINDLKNGKWTSYITMGDNFDKVKEEINYTNGKKNGIYKRYFDVRYKNDKEDHWSIINIPITESIDYKNDLKNGEYLLLDSLGKIIDKGLYSDDEKTGIWQEDYLLISKDEDEKFHIIESGEYVHDKRNGMWEYSYENNKVFKSENYKYGKLDGKTTSYNDENKVNQEKYYNEDKLIKIIVFDSLSTNISSIYDILFESKYDITCKRTYMLNGGKETQIYLLKNDPESEEVNIVKEFDNLNKGNTNDETLYASGDYFLYDSSDRILTEGQMLRKSKVSTWKYYYYDIGVRREIDENPVSDSIEHFYSLSDNRPFTGKFIQHYPNGKPKLEFSIEDGLRDGKSKYFNENGDTVLKEKYNKGIKDK